MEEKEFLLNLLKLSDGVIKKDNASITVIANAFNLAVITEEQQIRVKSCLSSFIEGESSDKNLALKFAINSINALNKNYLLSLIEIRNINLYNNLAGSKELILAKLSDTAITFDSDREKFTYYSFLVNLTIMSQDVNLIKTAMDKIQAV